MTARGQRSNRGKAVGLGLLACAALLLVLASSASALTLGVNWSGEPGWIESEMPLVAKSGAQAFRVPLPPTNNNDGPVRKASESGVTIHAEVSAEYPGDPGLPDVGPNRSDFLNKLSVEVRRYGYNGQFWSEPGNTSLPKKYITTWEIWNEPNLHGIGAAEFGQFVSEAANIIQAASQAQAGRNTDVLSGGLLVWGNKGAESVGYYGAMEYLSTAYANFGSNGNVTGVAIHPYELDDQTFFNGPATTRVEAFKYAVAGYHTKLVELAKGGAQKSLWITETGWPAEGPQYAIGEAEQANSLKQVVDYLRSNEAFLNVKDVIWYNFRDAPGTSSWDDYCGLRNHNGGFRQAWTAFQEKAGVPQVIPQAPGATTTGASGLNYTSATLNGTVNPGNLPTTYRFEYGTTTSYGSSIPIPDGSAGEGGGSVSKSAVVSSLQPGMTYYYRLVASNALGTTYGSASSFTTPKASKRSVIYEANGDKEIFFRGTDGQLKWWYWNATKSTWSLQWLGSAGAMAGDPVAFKDTNGDLDVFYRASDGQLHWWWWNAAKGSWSQQWLESGFTMAGDPAVLKDTNGDLDVFYRDTSGQLRWWWWNAAKGSWSLQWLESGFKMAGDPVPFKDTNGDLDVFYRDTSGQLRWWWRNAVTGSWSLQWKESGFTMAGDPAVLKDTNGDLDVFYRDTSGQLRWWWWNAANGSWSLQWLESGFKMAGDPVPFKDTNGDLDVFYRATNGQLHWWWRNAATGSWSQQWLGSENAMGGEPTPIKDSENGLEIYYGNSEGHTAWWWWHPGTWTLESLSGADTGGCTKRTGPSGYFASPTAWSTWSSAYTVSFADVNGDCREDLVGRNPTTADREVGLSTGSGFAASTSWGAWGSEGAYNFLLADVNGDGKADSLGRNSNTAEVRAGLSTGTNFNAATVWTTWSLGYSMAFADVNGDGRADLVGRNSTGNVQVGLSTGSSFAASTSWSSWGSSYSMELADVNADGRADLVGRNSTGEVQAGISTGSSFSASTSWGSWSVSSSPLFGDVNGDGRADILGRDSSNNVQVGRSTPG